MLRQWTPGALLFEPWWTFIWPPDALWIDPAAFFLEFKKPKKSKLQKKKKIWKSHQSYFFCVWLKVNFPLWNPYKRQSYVQTLGRRRKNVCIILGINWDDQTNCQKINHLVLTSQGIYWMYKYRFVGWQRAADKKIQSVLLFSKIAMCGQKSGWVKTGIYQTLDTSHLLHQVSSFLGLQCSVQAHRIQQPDPSLAHAFSVTGL